MIRLRVCFGWLLFLLLGSSPQALAQDQRYVPVQSPYSPVLIKGEAQPVCQEMHSTLTKQYFEPEDDQYSVGESERFRPFEEGQVSKPIGDSEYSGNIDIWTAQIKGQAITIVFDASSLAGYPFPTYYLFHGSPSNMEEALSKHRTRVEFLKSEFEDGKPFYSDWGGARFFLYENRVFFESHILHGADKYAPYTLRELSESGDVREVCREYIYPNIDPADSPLSKKAGGNLASFGPKFTEFLTYYYAVYGEPFGYQCGRLSSRRDDLIRKQIRYIVNDIATRPWRLSIVEQVTPLDVSRYAEFRQWSYNGKWSRNVYERLRDFPYDALVLEIAAGFKRALVMM